MWSYTVDLADRKDIAAKAVMVKEEVGGIEILVSCLLSNVFHAPMRPSQELNSLEMFLLWLWLRSFVFRWTTPVSSRARSCSIAPMTKWRRQWLSTATPVSMLVFIIVCPERMQNRMGDEHQISFTQGSITKNVIVLSTYVIFLWSAKYDNLDDETLRSIDGGTQSRSHHHDRINCGQAGSGRIGMRISIEIFIIFYQPDLNIVKKWETELSGWWKRLPSDFFRFFYRRRLPGWLLCFQARRRRISRGNVRGTEIDQGWRRQGRRFWFSDDEKQIFLADLPDLPVLHQYGNVRRSCH